MENPKYNFYATMLDTFEGYINSDRIYQAYWGFAENPSKTEDEFHLEQKQNLIDRINRVPIIKTENAFKGTAFNEIVDCIIENRTSKKMEIKSYPETNEIWCKYNDFLFKFPLNICVEFASYYKGAVTQHYTEAILNTKYGNVKLYGVIDELMPFKVADIKTVKKYASFDFRNNWQRLLYPYCLIQNGIDIRTFEFAVTDFSETWSEEYYFDVENDTRKLVFHCERLIEFIEENRSLITDTKIFGL